MATKTRREIIHIDEEKCDGCGLCIPACAEGALKIIDGKARLIGERLCDGLGACLGDCPQGAISIEVREAEAFDVQAVEEHLRSMGGIAEKIDTEDAVDCTTAGEIPAEKREGEQAEAGEMATLSSELTHWPVQLRLVPPKAKFLQNSHLLIAADCVPFAFADFHRRFLKGKALLIGCPKLDDVSFYLEKLVEIFRNNSPEKVTVLSMEIPCCAGLIQLVNRACEEAGNGIIPKNIVITIDGKIMKS